MNEQRMAKLEQGLKQLDRRLPKKVVEKIPPSVVSFYTEALTAEGTLFSFVAPFKGVVKAVAYHAEVFENQAQLFLDISHISGNTTLSNRERLSYAEDAFDTEYHVNAGDVLKAVVTIPEALQKVSLSLVIVPDPKMCKKFLLEEV